MSSCLSLQSHQAWSKTFENTLYPFTYSCLRLILLLNMSFGKSSNWLLSSCLSTNDDSQRIEQVFSCFINLNALSFSSILLTSQRCFGKNQLNPILNLALLLLMSVKTSIYDFSNYILLIGIPINLFDSLFTVYD